MKTLNEGRIKFMICKNCSHEIVGDASFCPNCGAAVVDYNPSEPLVKENTYQPKRQGGYSKYVFVVSLVLMIILVITVFTAFSSIADVNELMLESSELLSATQLALFNKMAGLMYGETALVFINFALTLALMIVASILMKKAKQNSSPSSALLKTQLILSISASVLSVVYVVFEIVAINQLGIIAKQLEVEITASYTNLIGPIAIAGLLIPCIFKSLGLLKKS